MIHNEELLEKVMFPVALEAVQAKDSTSYFGSGINAPRFRAIVRKDTNQVVSVVTDRYQLMSNSDLLTPSLDMIDAIGVDARVAKAETYNDGRRFLVEMAFPDAKVRMRDGSDIEYRLIIGGSYDGTKRAYFQAGAFRLICTNGMRIGTIDWQVSSRHMGSGITELPAVIANRIPKMLDSATVQMGEALGPIWSAPYFVATSPLARMLRAPIPYSQDGNADETQTEQRRWVNSFIPHLPAPVQDRVVLDIQAHRMGLVPAEAEGPINKPVNLYNLLTNRVSTYGRKNYSEERRSAALASIHRVVTNSLELVA